MGAADGGDAVTESVTSDYIERPDDQKVIAALAGKASLAPDEQKLIEDNVLLVSGSGLAGKSELLKWSKRAFSAGDGDDILTAHGVLTMAGETADESQHIDAWAHALRSMRDDIESAARSRGLNAPRFALFDAFYNRCVVRGSDVDVPFGPGLKVIGGLAAALILASDVFSQFSIQDWAEAAARWLEPILPGADIVLSVLFYGVLILALVYNAIEGSVPKLIVWFRDSQLRKSAYSRFGQSPLKLPERLEGTAGPSGANGWPGEFNEEILIKAFNADLAEWLMTQPEDRRVLIALDLQDLPPSSMDEARARIRRAVDTTLGRETRASNAEANPLLKARAPIALCSKFVEFGPPSNLPSPLLAALERPHELNFLSREAAWDMVGNRIANWLADDRIGNKELWKAMLAARSLPRPDNSDPWSLRRGRNSPEQAKRTRREFVNLAFAKGKAGDYHLLLIQVALAFGGLTASNALTGSGILRDGDFDQRLAGSIDLRLRHFLKVSQGILDRDFASAAAFRTSLIELTTAPKGTHETRSAIPTNAIEEFKRAFGYGPQGLAQSAILLAPFRFGLSYEDLEWSRLDVRVDELRKSRKIRIDGNEGERSTRVVLGESDRQVVLHARAHEAVEITEAYRNLRNEIEDGVDDFRRDTQDVANRALTWLSLVSLTKATNLESLAMRLEDIADRALTLGGYSHLTEQQNLELQHRIGEAAMRVLGNRSFPERGPARRWDPRDGRPALVGILEAIVQRYMRRFAFGQMDVAARAAFVKMLREQGSYSPVVRDLARFLVEQGGSARGGDWRDQIALLHQEDCRQEALERLIAMNPEPLAPDFRIDYLRLLRKSADSLAGRCLPQWQHDPDLRTLEKCIARAERDFLAPLFDAMQEGMAALPGKAGEIAFMALRTSVFWQQKLARFPVAQETDETGRPLFESLAAASRSRQAFIVDFLEKRETRFSPASVDDFADVTGLLAIGSQVKGERPDLIDRWLEQARQAFFKSAVRLLEEGSGEEAVAGDRFAQAAPALAISLSARWQDEKCFLSDDRDRLWPSMVALREAYCDFATRRFALVSGFDGSVTEDAGYRAARARFAETQFYREFSAREAREAMAAMLLEVVAHATPDHVPDQPGTALVADRFGLVEGAGLGLDDDDTFLVCRSTNGSTLVTFPARLAPTRRWTKEFKELPTARTLAEMEEVRSRPIMINLLGGSEGLPEGVLRATGKGGELVNCILDTLLPLAPSGSDGMVKLGGSGAIGVLGVTGAQLDCFDAAGSVLAQFGTELASLERIILYEVEDRTPSLDPAAKLADLERDMSRFLGRAMTMSWHIDGDRPRFGKDDDGDPGLASQQTIRKGEDVPAFLPRFSEESGTVNLLSLHPNPERPSHSAPKLRTVHSLFPRVFRGTHPEYEFDQVQAMLRKIDAAVSAEKREDDERLE